MSLTRKFRSGMCAALVVGGTALVGCAPVENPPGGSGHTLCFAYYQQCVNRIFDESLPIDYDNNGTIDAMNTCSGAGCHDNTSGTGGAFRVIPHAASVSSPVTDPDAVKGPPAVDIYRNFYSAQGASDMGSPAESRLLTKPLLEALHGGGRIFFSRQDSNAQQLLFWIEHPAPDGKDEFCDECNDLFVGGAGGTCRIF
jgi:hypothetical protein